MMARRRLFTKIRTYQIIVCFMIFAVIFILFQFLSVGKVAKLSEMAIRSEPHREKHEKKNDNSKLEGHEEKQSMHTKQSLPRPTSQIVNTSTFILGVKVSDQKFYVKGSDEKFTCRDSREKIAFAAVNDDFCDCKDGTDEPGTAACSNGRFYCSHVPDGGEQVSLPSSAVSDGICDCCDASDERAQVQLPSHLLLSASSMWRQRQAPCRNTCGAADSRWHQNVEAVRRGKAAKQMYLAAGKAHAHNNEFGTAGCFFSLKGKCWTHDAAGYRYRICPFDRVTQERVDVGVAGRTNLGQHTNWRTLDKVLVMSGGDSQLCPQDDKRMVTIMFDCGVEDKVESVSEPETCRYQVNFVTPAAC